MQAKADHHRFYAPILLPHEHVDLTPMGTAHTLDGEIGLLRILIRRHLALPHIDQTLNGRVAQSGDARKIRDYVDALCRAIATRRPAGDNPRQQFHQPFPSTHLEIKSASGGW